MRPVPLVELTRGDHAESWHHGWLVVVDARGRVLEAHGDDVALYARSSVKPFQALPLLETGVALSPAQWAIACSSHGATEAHLAVVRSLLERGELNEAMLGCGPHWPLDEATAEAMRARGKHPRALHSNCSGKHAGMLLACRLNGWPLEEYWKPEHPLQRSIGHALARWALLAPEAMSVAVDGCGVPTWRLPLSALARAFSGLGTAIELAPLARAMAAHPELVASQGRFDTILMEALGGTVLAKGGAEGVHAGVCRSSGVAWALKIADGNRRAVSPLVVGLLRRHRGLEPGEEAALLEWAAPVLRNAAGTGIGTVRSLV